MLAPGRELGTAVTSTSISHCRSIVQGAICVCATHRDFPDRSGGRGQPESCRNVNEEREGRPAPPFSSELKVGIKRQGQVAVLVECRGVTCWVGRDLGPQPLG